MRPMIDVNELVITNDKGVLLDRLTFAVEPGEILLILGASGCGKSTLLKHLFGQWKPTSGEILIDGESIVTCNEAERLQLSHKFGVLYQSGALFGSMTLEENVGLALEEHTDLPPDIIRSVARAKLAAVGLAGFESFPPSKISGGMKKRAGLARALALDPPLLFLDEPSAGLDPISAAGLDNLLLDLRDTYGTTFVIVSHELDSILDIADRVLVLKDKRVIAHDSVANVTNNPPDPWIVEFFGRDGTRPIELAQAS
jgi:phospholipid/cholesterol/gamma-HCH transport system ATP-binding protein